MDPIISADGHVPSYRPHHWKLIVALSTAVLVLAIGAAAIGLSFGRGSAAPASQDITAAVSQKTSTQAGSLGRVAATQQIQAPRLGTCSDSFGVCVFNRDRAWSVSVDTSRDFDLRSASGTLALAILSSPSISYKPSGKAFASVRLLGSAVSAYKRSSATSTMVIAGRQYQGKTFVAMIFSAHDISAATASSTFARIVPIPVATSTKTVAPSGSSR